MKREKVIPTYTPKKQEVAKNVTSQDVVTKEVSKRRCEFTNNVCPYWFVEVSDEECMRCHEGDQRSKLDIIERSIRSGVKRNMNPELCIFREKIINKTTKACCGGTKTSTVATIECKLKKKHIHEHHCRACKHYSED